jgi:hypothetical protein
MLRYGFTHMKYLAIGNFTLQAGLTVHNSHAQDSLALYN